MDLRLSAVTILFASATCAFAQKDTNRKALFVQSEYQFLNQSFVSVGIGYQPHRNVLFRVARKHPTWSFQGWAINLLRSTSSDTWGASAQALLCTATASGPFAAGVEVNYLNHDDGPHWGIKPQIGLSFPVVSVLYGYTFSVTEANDPVRNGNEIAVVLRFPVLSRSQSH